MLGVLAVVASFMTWVDLSDVGAEVFNPTGFGPRPLSRKRLTPGLPALGWVTVPLGIAVIVAGVLASMGRRFASVVVTGCGAALLVIAVSVCVWTTRVAMSLAQIGAESMSGSVGRPTMGVFVLLAAGLCAVLVGVVGAASSTTDCDAPRRAVGTSLAVAIGIGVALGVIAVAGIWWLYSEPRHMPWWNGS